MHNKNKPNCTRNREHYFGEIAGGEMHLSGMGQYAHEQMRDVTIHYPYAEIPFWVVMPNHIHAIVIIDGDNIPTERRNIKKWRDNMETCHPKTGTCRANTGTCRATSLQTGQRPDGDEMKRNTALMQGWLSVVVGGNKIRDNQIFPTKRHPICVAGAFLRPYYPQSG